MFKSISEFLTHNFGSSDNTGAAKQASGQIELAAAVLMVEAAMMDEHFDAEEKSTIEDILSRRFSLSQADARQLLELAIARQEDAIELHRFTNSLKRTLSQEERNEIIEMLWEVAYADGVVHVYEDNLIRRVAGLIHVSDRDRGEAKKRVMERLHIS